MPDRGGDISWPGPRGTCHPAGMSENGKLSRQQISDTASEWGWRHILGALAGYVRAGSLAEAADLAARLMAYLGDVSGHRLRVDLRDDRLILTVEAGGSPLVTRWEIELAHRISAFFGTLGLVIEPGLSGGEPRAVQAVEIGIDAMDIGAIRPFWKAVMGYTGELDADGPEDGLIDPLCQGPSIWFQQMDQPRPQRNRIHFDVVVPHDEAKRRIGAAIAAGGKLTYDAEAPAFWVLADPEGNEACVCTWQGRE
jgi:4a-hydroxytetrahydrobiopterin dehydratase